nr:probable E3 ubiquitin ligase SUD1 isoform X1 [Ipomoea batatas]
MVSKLAGEGAMPPQLPTPARRLLKIAKLRDCLRQQIRRGSLLLRRGVTKLKVFYYFNRSIRAVQSINQQRWRRFSSSIVSGSSWSRSAKSLSKVLIMRHFFAIYKRSRSVKFSSRVLVDVVVFAVFSRSSRSRSAESSSAELVLAISSPQWRTRNRKQTIPPIPDFASEKSQRKVSNLKNRVGELRSEIKAPTANIKEAIERKKFRGAVAEIDSWSRSMDTNLCSVFSKPEQVLRLVLGSAFTERLYQAISLIPKMSFAKREHEFLKEIGIGTGNLGRYAKGAWKASGPTISTVNPANNETVVEVVETSIEDYEEGMLACNGVAKLWMQIPTPKRGDIVMTCDSSYFDAILENKVPLVLSVGALDMVSLMRTTADENKKFAVAFIAEKLNKSSSKVCKSLFRLMKTNRPEDNSGQENGNGDQSRQNRVPDDLNRIRHATTVNGNSVNEDDGVEQTDSDWYGFVLRIVLLLVVAWMTLLIFNYAMIIVPISLGRPLFNSLPLLPITHGIKCNDLYAFVVEVLQCQVDSQVLQQ